MDPHHLRCGIGSPLKQNVEAVDGLGLSKINFQLLGTNVEVSVYEEKGYRVEDRVSMREIV